MTMIDKRWKIECFTKRVLNINADRVIPLHQVTILTEENEIVMFVKVDHLETLESAVRSQIELGLAQHIVDLHNKSLAPISKDPPLTKTQSSVTSSPSTPKKKGGWPKGKPRGPRAAASGKEEKGSAPQQKRSANTGATQANQGAQTKEGVQAQPFPPSGEGWFRP